MCRLIITVNSVMNLDNSVIQTPLYIGKGNVYPQLAEIICQSVNSGQRSAEQIAEDK